MAYEVDITIIGAGVVGLAVACELASENHNVFVLEKNHTFGVETSSRNSQVIHSGIYNPPGSLKSRMCLEGKALLYEMCHRTGIGHSRLGKLVVAPSYREVGELEKLLGNGMRNGVEDLRMLSRRDVAKLEPNVSAVAALYSPSAGIIDAHALMRCLASKIRDMNGNIVCRAKVVGVERKRGAYQVTVHENGRPFRFSSNIVVNSAGLGSDSIAGLAGIDVARHGYRLFYNKGEYFRVNNVNGGIVQRLVYPVPPLTGSGLGIHMTPTLDGRVLLGPSSRYVDREDYSVGDGLAETFRDCVARFVPCIRHAAIGPEMAGIRPTRQGPGAGFKDFVVTDETDKGLRGLINLIGIESPGLTASLAIGKHVASLVRELRW